MKFMPKTLSFIALLVLLVYFNMAGVALSVAVFTVAMTVKDGLKWLLMYVLLTVTYILINETCKKCEEGSSKCTSYPERKRYTTFSDAMFS